MLWALTRKGIIMKNKLSVLFSLILCIAMLAACTAENTSSPANNGTATTANGAASISATVKYDSEDDYFDWKSQRYQTINLDNSLTTISKSGIYEITGTLKDGSLEVDIDKTVDTGIVYLVLNNASISSTASAPIYIKDAKKGVLILENGTTNTIYQGSDCVADENNEPSAAIFSKSDLTITGSGTLNVTSDYNDGITSKDTLKITDGTLLIKTKADGFVGKDILAVE